MTKQLLKPGWHPVKFGEVVCLSKVRSSDPLADGYDRFIGLEHIEPEDLRIRRWGNVADGVTFTSVFKPGQVLFGKRRAYQRKVAVADFAGVCSGDIYVLESKDPKVLQPELLSFICQTERFFRHAVGTSAGSLSPRTNWTSLAEFEFNLPPIDQQRRILTLLKSCVTCEESYRNLQDNAFDLRQSIICDFIISHANQFDLGDLILEGPQNGLYVPSTKYGSGTSILRIDSFYDGKISGLFALKEVDIDDFTIQKYALNENDIVINRVNSREFVGKAARIPALDRNTVFESNMMRFSIDLSKALPEYVNIFINHSSVKQQILARCKDAINQSSINQGDVCSLRIPRASISDQQAFLRQIRDLESLACETLSRKKAMRQIRLSVWEGAENDVQ